MRQYNIKKKNNKIYGFPILDAENAKALLYKRNKEMNDEQIKSYEKALEPTKKAKLSLLQRLIGFTKRLFKCA